MENSLCPAHLSYTLEEHGRGMADILEQVDESVHHSIKAELLRHKSCEECVQNKWIQEVRPDLNIVNMPRLYCLVFVFQCFMYNCNTNIII